MILVLSNGISCFNPFFFEFLHLYLRKLAAKILLENSAMFLIILYLPSLYPITKTC
uniref:Uncharacterized protein n=1 Tax=Nelumbo nucifera TaxID=4432 RepID=A0A822XQX0_NELNU|nr:TPA_asm: hypothetical protein HUJ06_022608 [Nelumbo nucifera]